MIFNILKYKHNNVIFNCIVYIALLMFLLLFLLYITTLYYVLCLNKISDIQIIPILFEQMKKIYIDTPQLHNSTTYFFIHFK